MKNKWRGKFVRVCREVILIPIYNGKENIFLFALYSLIKYMFFYLFLICAC